MSDPILSLVVPVYNVAPYLPRCLESLAALTPPADEIIVVDDGSTDDCPRILAEFAPRLPRMRVIRQENGGLSAARNTGLDAARGKYLAFLDSDDFVEPGMYAHLLTLAEQDSLDIALCNGWYHYEGRKPDWPIYSGVPDSGVTTGKEWLEERLLGRRFVHMVWLHLYRREFIESNSLRFVPRLIHEDVIWTTEALLLANRVRFSPLQFVRYRIPVRIFSPEALDTKLINVVASSIFNTKRLIELADTYGRGGRLQTLLYKQTVDGGFAIFHMLKKISSKKVRAEQAQLLIQSGYIRTLYRASQSIRNKLRVLRKWSYCQVLARLH